MVGSNSKVTSFVKLLMGIRKYVAENIDKRLGTIYKYWEIGVEGGFIIRIIHILGSIYKRT
jgi:hypothetical protein